MQMINYKIFSGITEVSYVIYSNERRENDQIQFFLWNFTKIFIIDYIVKPCKDLKWLPEVDLFLVLWSL